MLKLKNIKKTYKVDSGDVEALKGINLDFRESEFVCILGPSGCGKTTLLNIVGGLDKYTSGDLFIKGRSTKKFTDRDWDSYRNHSIGFIFQSYNLIPHQTVLGNVELSLTISGISKEERVKRAKEALDKVGLEGQYYKRPNQLSGGQCQRVAIARALVNEPDILLADEPTGALDTVTSKQIMDLVQEIAEQRLVIMVTHNPELADKYATRIIKLRDGEVTDDTNPYIEDQATENTIKKEKSTTLKKTKMSFFTAFRLSLQNLFTKKRRTLMTSFAGAIGIIGVSAVLSVSNGIQTFVDNMQEDMLSGNPITIEESALDLSSMMSMTTTEEKKDIIRNAGFVNVHSMVEELVKRSESMSNMMISNDITEAYINYLKNMPAEYRAMLSFKYGINVANNIYTDFKESPTASAQNMSLSTIQNIYTAILNKTEYADYSSFITSLSEAFVQAPSDEEYILSQYELLNGKVAKDKNEIMIVVDSDRQLTDLLLTQLGYYTQDEFTNIIYRTSGSGLYTSSLDREQYSYDELLNKKFVWYPNDVVFKKNTDITKPGVSFNYNAYSNSSFTDGLELKVVGILEPKEDVSYGSLSSGFFYTEELANYIIENNYDSQIIKHLKDNNETSFTSMKYSVEGMPSFDVGITYTFSFNFRKSLDSIKESYTETGYVGSTSALGSLLGSIMGGSSGTQTDIYTLSLRELGGEKLANSIAIYSRNFDEKNLALSYLDNWNSSGDIIVNGVTIKADDRSKITYSDTLSIIMSMISTFINIITIALIAFTSLSLVVSCVMIAIITYVSVVERVKEIGVIRSLGGRKQDVSYLFNAETFIIGLVSGVMGVLVTYLLSFVINLIVNNFAGIGKIAIFPISYALIMISISIVLNLISGLLPSRSAAKKDPVVALRTE